MKNTATKESFIELRAHGYSYAAISKKLSVSKPTLIKWNKDLSQEVSNLLYFQVESLLEQYKHLKIHRIETLVNIFKKAQEELAQRDFKDVPTKDLLNLVFSLETALGTELNDIKFHTGDTCKIFDISDEREITLDLPY